MRRWSLAAQMLALQLVVVVVTVTGGAVLALVQAHDLLTDEAEATALAVAESVAVSPDVVQALSTGDPSVTLQPYARRVQVETGVDFITIMDTSGLRYTHPNPAQIGKPFLGHIEEAVAGRSFTETYTGTLGLSMRAVVPVFAERRVVALVSAGITVERISARLLAQAPWTALIAAAGLGAGAGGSWLVGARLRRQTHGLGPVELARIHDHHDAILHTVREGLLLVGDDGTLILCNDAARTLLGLPPDAEGRAVAELGLPWPRPTGKPGTPGVPGTDTQGATDEIHLVGDRVLAVSAAPSRLGTVVTLRDHTELQALAGQLDAERGFADSLRAAAHESANRLHTVITLVELGRPEQAVAFGTAELKAAQELADRVMASVREPVLAALLLGKSAAAAERGVELSIDEASHLPDTLPGIRDLVTVLGNLIDNAIEAARGQAGVLVRARDGELLVQVSDDGPGLTHPDAFSKGWTTKGDGRGLGLALVGSAVRRLKGTVEVTGSTFTVRVPYPGEAAQDVRPTSG
ncbi:ATP-binding protein [Nonomuraea soli]|uniref:histidine kinase n=1 Tax=Nonomuraea soli TaxID=1032476 RepID=A0A7W0CG60_9ACTN|nr:sensor histidine kinase [Nonomuraea soli]MBA2890592.1 sensor histidine kinase regulating citrate/malate metabolism [Nonomuraea soli]